MRPLDWLLTIAFLPLLIMMWVHRKITGVKFPIIGIIAGIPICTIWMLFLVWVVNKIGLIAIGR